jgi:hypothetical protein
VKLQDGVLVDLRYATPHFDVSPTGVLVYAPASGVAPSASLVWVAADGRQQNVHEDPYLDLPRLSLDGRYVVFASTQSDRQKDLWSYDLVAGRRSRLTSAAGEEHNPVISPDNRSVIFKSWRAKASLSRMPLTGGAEDVLVPAGDPAPVPWSFSSDGRWLAISGGGGEQERNDIGVIDLQASALTVQWLARTPFIESQPIFSPKAGLIAYVSDQLGQPDIWITAFPVKDGQSPIPVSREGGIEPVWSSDGRTLYFAAGAKLLAVTIEPGDQLKVSAPRDVMTLKDLTIFGAAPDGRFLAVRRDRTPVTRIDFVLNWSEELKQKVK